MFTLNIRRKNPPLQRSETRESVVTTDKGFRRDLRAYGQIIEQFTRTVRSLEQAYVQLQRRVEILTEELRKKQSELSDEKRHTEEIQSRLDYVLLAMRAGVIAVDTEGKITVFNRAAESITGLRAENVLGRPYEATVQKVFGFQQGPLTALADNREYIGLEDRVSRCYDGNSRPCFVRRSVTLIRNGEQETIGALEILEDVTALKQLQAEHQKASNWNALGEMARQFAHKVRNPLGGIMGFASLLERDFADDDPRRLWVKKIQEGASRLDKYISDLLLFTRPLTPERSKQDLRHLTSRAIQQANLRGRDVVTEFPGDDRLQFETDGELFLEILGHILEFAGTWACEDSPIKIQYIDGSDDSLELEVAFQPISGQRAIERQEEEERSNWFSEEEGLALAIASRLTDLLDGRFEVVAQGDRRILIRIVLPR